MKLKRKFLKNIEEWSLEKPLSIVGATGSGKTSTLLSFLRSTSLRPLLLSLDSVAAYKELDIGSSKPLGSDLSDFAWQGLSFVSPTEAMNATRMRDEVLPFINQAIAKNDPMVFVGGTHFYERFILEGPAPGKASSPEFLAELAKTGVVAVYEKLLQQDKRWSNHLHVNDEYRVFRYADLVLRQGLCYEELKAGSESPLFPEVECLILNSEKESLEPKLKKRIAEMFALGWIEETRNILTKYGAKAPALQSVGYAEIVEFLTNKPSEQDFTQLQEAIFIRHRQLAKQQRTWLRKLAHQV
ncbi:MAG: tRNA (adenosine(37)-N6)-dimethylallyltransferase MiaA [Bdellovibrionota bacterium]